ncbi:ferrochelatase [Paenibacillus sp. ACRRX]|uniref:ferrochelatase n=1 Tax=unclassified Paenibacillus TaxID=185978 RepID=UPI001EF3F9D1|nr:MULTISPECIES: ferrochelatase [unclassified Paenibacillus]MCG7406008.1 ferrochelatase [Paenibacillus sp. ACRRX]MDK8182461.1 ferrochelatase [Paenibacillus sp. UMB4589-SE434]
MSKRKVGVLVMSYGTPSGMDQIEAYYTHIRRGNPPSADQLEELSSRYEAIVGGVFPLREHTNLQVAALQAELDQRTSAQDVQYVCYQGLKHAAPFIEDGIASMAQDGIHEAIGIVLAPHYSVMSIGGYLKRAKEEAEKHDIDFRGVESYHLHPKLVEALAIRVKEQLEAYEQEGVSSEDVHVLFSAHSLPTRILEMNDPYPAQLLETSEAIAEQCFLDEDQWRFTWQSAGQTGTPWLGPDILDTLQTVKAEGKTHVLSAPIGFVSDHLEVLYDLDIETTQRAQELGVGFKRTRSLNHDPLYIQVLADSVMLAEQ